MLVQPTSPNRRLDLKFHIVVSSTYSLDDLPWHQSGSLSASFAFLNWTEFVSTECIYTTIYDPHCEDRVNFSQASYAQYVANVLGNLGFRAAPRKQL